MEIERQKLCQSTSLDNKELGVAHEVLGNERLCVNGYRKNEIIEEVKKQLWLAGPLIAVSLLQRFIQVISLMFVGHLGALSLSAASMADSFVSMTSLSFLVGMASALDTLCGQSYGAKQYHMLGILMQRAMFFQLLICIPLAIIVSKTTYVLNLVGQNAEIAAEAGQYANYLIPGLFAFAILSCQIRFLRTQNLVFPMMLVTGFTTLVHSFMCWILVFKLELGNKGPALAYSISYWINVFLLAGYMKFSPSCANTWTGFSMEAFHNIVPFLRLAVPSALMTCLKFWSFEVMIFLSGKLPNPKLETSVFAISIRVANEVGAGRPRAAILAIIVATVMSVSQCIFVGAVLILTRKTLGYAYSSEIEVVKYVATLLPIISIGDFLDSFQCILSGIVKGCGWQKIGAYVNLGSYYIVGIPTTFLLAFVLHLGVQLTALRQLPTALRKLPMALLTTTDPPLTSYCPQPTSSALRQLPRPPGNFSDLRLTSSGVSQPTLTSQLPHLSPASYGLRHLPRPRQLPLTWPTSAFQPLPARPSNLDLRLPLTHETASTS
ncbi:hypothetical protein FNV43_RR21393 [Rhamnella rubrinervis]|uniref:Protein DETOXIFICATION n=1 Tax=Rhamnella rubrinervis TaxID=2594499 RepID=A0A8K0E390_9ROSA|nr:hypothetical protein FNV43_RR21393 [Rhamnella rubrinervis]